MHSHHILTPLAPLDVLQRLEAMGLAGNDLHGGHVRLGPDIRLDTGVEERQCFGLPE